MHIAFINSTRKWGGVKTWTIDFAEQLVARGHKVFIYGRQEQFVDVAQKRVGHGIKVKFGSDLSPFSIYYFYKQFKKHKVDVVVVNVGKDLSTAGVAARLLNIPVIQRIGLPNDIPYRHKTKLLHSFIKPLFLSPCEFIKQGFLKSLPYVVEDKTAVVLNGKKAEEVNIIAHKPRVLITTQQLNADKGHDTLLRALAMIDLPYKLHVVGTGHSEEYLKKLAETLGIADKIVWHGFVTNVKALLKEADIFLLASLVEGLPNTLLEALASGLLPIVRDVGGVKEVLSSELLPWVLPYEADENDFRKEIEKALLLADAELIKVKKQAYKACFEHCNLDKQVIELESLLKRVSL
ncbi:glycosyltransferase [Desulfovibrio litoralis]|uniref:Glycosyltransferase involved in cell wall bisynthesis n=1 Tax=Desulfovibrio litoralis DSM 11393 TaxID=1121455 RepID=A0A1M7T7H4_9BACT|nr:glycosyltransferase [Desulfovibrio litoralis]SHN66627.1 Glycosyltransferase involved in cell wall bisynthesis [Desulfovibrio litoralis DSM 11393]